MKYLNLIKLNRYKLLLLLTFVLLISKTYYIYQYLINNSIPVYDGVINEKNQILRFLNFKNTFSFIERYNQIIYEFAGNHVTSIFNIICIAISPKLLINDIDIFARGIIAILILFFSIHYFVNKQLKTSSLIFLSITTLPTLFHYRFGLFTYIPDIISGLFLLSAYFYTLIYLRNKKIKYLFYTVSLIFLAIGFRYNFFVYAGLIFMPISLLIIKDLFKEKKFKSNKILFLLIFGVIGITIFYVYFHFEAFIEYYGRDAKYAEISLISSIKSTVEYLTTEINLLFIVSLLIINIIINNFFYTSSVEIKNYLLVYPFFSMLIFLVFFMHATNQPHVFSAFFLFIIPIAFLKNKFLVIKNITNKKYFITSLILMNLIINFSCFYTKLNMMKNKEIDNSGVLLANKIDEITKFKKEKKYFLLFESALEIPLDVYFFKKYKTLYENKLKYYYTDFEYYSIDKNLNYQTILNHYITEIEKTKPELIILNSENLNLGKDKTLGIKINNGLREFVRECKKYTYFTSMRYKNQKILFYKL